MARAVEGAVGGVHAAGDDRPVVHKDTADRGLVCVKGELCLCLVSIETLMGANSITYKEMGHTIASASRIKPSWCGRSSGGKVSGGLGSGLAGCSLPSILAGASIFVFPVSSLMVFLFMGNVC